MLTDIECEIGHMLRLSPDSFSASGEQVKQMYLNMSTFIAHLAIQKVAPCLFAVQALRILLGDETDSPGELSLECACSLLALMLASEVRTKFTTQGVFAQRLRQLAALGRDGKYSKDLVLAVQDVLQQLECEEHEHGEDKLEEGEEAGI